ISIEALKHDKHILLEKPISTNLENASLIIRMAEKYNKIAMVGYIERFNPSLRRVKELVANGEVGELSKVSSRRASKFMGKPEWVWDKVGMMIHVCGHDVDIL